jgi:hypothetical protein
MKMGARLDRRQEESSREKCIVTPRLPRNPDQGACALENDVSCAGALAQKAHFASTCAQRVHKVRITAAHNTYCLRLANEHHYPCCRMAASPCGSSEPDTRQRRYQMDMTQRLNVLMTLLSAGFIAAIALGML